MARPVMRDPAGRWSLTQVAAEAGVTSRTARTVVAAGYLDADRLGYRDIVMMRVAAALLEAPRPAGLTRDAAAEQTKVRNFEALRLTRSVLDDPAPAKETRLAVLPASVRLATDAFTLMGAIGEAATSPMLLLPVGEWALALRDILLSGQARERAS